MPHHAKLGNAPIRALRVRREDDQSLHYAFAVFLEDGSEKQVMRSQALSLKQLVKELRSYSSDIAESPSEAERQVRAILDEAPEEIQIGVVQPGWKNARSKNPAFVAPDWCGGPRCSSYIWLGDSIANDAAGTHAKWLLRIATPCRKSTYLSFALMLSLSGPLRVFADDLPEGAVFHLYGDPSTGKTTAARVAASLFRSPEDLPGWSQSARSLEELAGRYRDHLLILNAAEKAYDHEQKYVLHSLTHRIAEGRGKSRSRSVQHSFPDVTTRSPILSTGNYSGPEMARNVKLKWAEQDQARFISIPVPKAAAGGVVDLAPGEDHARPGSELIQQLEQALRANYGKSLRRWVRIAWLHRSKVNSLMDEFVNKVDANSSHDRRIARKFGFVYAAGTIAVNGGFLNWRKSVPFNATRRLFELAMSEPDARSPAQHLQALVNALQDLPDCGNHDYLTLKKGQPFIGLKFRREGKRFIGVRAEELSTIVPGTGAIYALLNALDQAGVLEKGHGGKRAKQVNISVTTGEGETIRKPRLLVMQAGKLTDLLKNESS